MPIITGAGAFFKKGKAHKMNKEFNYTGSKDEIRQYVLKAFDYSIEGLTDEFRQEVRTLNKMYMGWDLPDENPMYPLMTGFLLGLGAAEEIKNDLEAMTPWHSLAVSMLENATESEAKGLCNFMKGYLASERK